MGFIREVDRALAKAIMSEFVRLQLIVGDDLNTSLWAMHADLEATTSELIRDLDIATQNSIELPSKNPAVGACFTCLLYTSPSPRDATLSRMPSSA